MESNETHWATLRLYCLGSCKSDAVVHIGVLALGMLRAGTG